MRMLLKLMRYLSMYGRYIRNPSNTYLGHERAYIIETKVQHPRTAAAGRATTATGSGLKVWKNMRKP